MRAIETSVGMLLAAMVMVAGCSRPEQDDPRTQPPLVRVTTVSDRFAGEQSFTGVVTARVQSRAIWDFVCLGRSSGVSWTSDRQCERGSR